MEVSKIILPSAEGPVQVGIKDTVARQAIANLDVTPDVTDKNVTLEWGTLKEIATIGELSIHVTLPNNPNTNLVESVSGKTGVVVLTKTDIGLDNVSNDAQVKRTEMGVAEGVATLNSSGKIPSSQLPSFVDDIIEGYLGGAHFYQDSEHTTLVTDATGASTDLMTGKIYVDLATNKTYRWGGSTYSQISSDIAIGSTTGTAADGGVVTAHINNTNNPHEVTKAQIGLSNVTNDAQVKRTEMGVASGVATLDSTGKVTASLLSIGTISNLTILDLFDGESIDDEDVVIAVPTATEDIEAMWDNYDPLTPAA